MIEGYPHLIGFVILAIVIGIVIVACGGGGGDKNDASPNSVTKTIPDFKIDQTTDRMVLDETVADGYNVGAGTFRVEFDMVWNNAWKANPKAHWAVITRSDNHRLNSKGEPKIWGSGLANGVLFYGPNPQALPESWYGEKEGDHWLYENYLAPAQVDNVKYTFVIETSVDASNNRFIRYTQAREGVLEYDSGLVADENTFYDPSKTGFAIAYVFTDNLEPWSLDFSRVSYTWSRG